MTPKLGTEITVGSRSRSRGRSDMPFYATSRGAASFFCAAAPALRRSGRLSPPRNAPCTAQIHLIYGARDAYALYMEAALRKAARHPGTSVRVALENPHPTLPDARAGTPAEHMPPLTEDDTVFAAGGPRMVEAARAQAEAAGARFYADPFTPAAQRELPPPRASRGLPAPWVAGGERARRPNPPAPPIRRPKQPLHSGCLSVWHHCPRHAELH